MSSEHILFKSSFLLPSNRFFFFCLHLLTSHTTIFLFIYFFTFYSLKIFTAFFLLFFLSGLAALEQELRRPLVPADINPIVVVSSSLSGMWKPLLLF